MADLINVYIDDVLVQVPKSTVIVVTPRKKWASIFPCSVTIPS